MADDVAGLVRFEDDAFVVRRPEGVSDERWAWLRQRIRAEWDERVRELLEGRQ